MKPEGNMAQPPIDFALAPSGPIDKAHLRLRITHPDSPRVVLRAIAVAVLAWLPLLIASLISPAPPGTTISFFHDIAVHVRFLLVVPLLIISEASIGPRTRMVVGEFVNSGLVGDEALPRFQSLVRRAMTLLNAVWAELMLVLLTAGLVWISIHAVTNEESLFWFERATRGGVTFAPAGWWYAFVATPISVYLFLRWTWRYVVWTWFLGRVSRLRLRLSASHPDRVGGLGFLTFHQTVFASLTLAAGCGLSAAAANRILYTGASLKEHQAALIAFMVIAIVIGIAPLLAFTPALVRAKHRGIFEYGRLGTDYVQSFEQKWLTEKSAREETLLGSGDIQSLADMGGSFERVSRMSPVPLDRRIVITFALAAMAPALPLLLTVMPLKEIAQLLVKVLV